MGQERNKPTWERLGKQEENALSLTHTHTHRDIYIKKQASDINLGECCRGNNSSSR
jgi:hypothetical protein